MIKQTAKLRKTYIPPRIKFEDIEGDERDYLLAASGNSAGGGGFEEGGGDAEERSLRNIDFSDMSCDFVVNENE